MEISTNYLRKTFISVFLPFYFSLVRAFFLIDGKTGFGSFDEDALNMLESYGTPYAVSN